MKKLLLCMFLLYNYTSDLWAQETVSVVNMNPISGGSGNAFVFSRFGSLGQENLSATYDLSSNGYTFPFRILGQEKVQQNRFIPKLPLYGFTSDDVRTVYTSTSIDNMMKTLNTSIQSNNTLIDTFSKQLNQMPCQLLLDENSPCYQNLINKIKLNLTNQIISELEKKYILVPKN